MDWQSKRKQDDISQREVRDYKLRVMLNADELSFLDTVRGRRSRAETMRFLLQNSTPPASIPQLNADAWVELSRASANLNQLARHLNSGGAADAEAIRRELEEFRSALIGAAR